MSRAKIHHQKEKHNVWFEPEVWARIVYFAEKIKKSVEWKGEISLVVNEACKNFKRTEDEDFHELRKELARKMALLQEQMRLVDEVEAAAIRNKKNELTNELKTAFEAKKEASA